MYVILSKPQCVNGYSVGVMKWSSVIIMITDVDTFWQVGYKPHTYMKPFDGKLFACHTSR